MKTDPIYVWNNCLSVLKIRINKNSFQTWFMPIKPIKLINNTLTIQVPNRYFYEWIEQRYIGILQKALQKELGMDARLEYSIASTKEENQPLSRIKKYSPWHGTDGMNAHKSAISKKSHLASKYIFDNFIEGNCNQFCRSAGMQISQNPGKTAFNPFIIYGGVGLGKTHLVQAIGNQIKKNLPNQFVLYVSTEEFTNQFIESLRNKEIQLFINYYLQVDTLIIDDIQFLAKKIKTQENFFHIFNQLHQAGKQIIITSDQPPSQLKGLEDRLLSRFKWGLSSHLYSPDYETRIIIIKRKLKEQRISLVDSMVDYIAKYVNTNIRELEGVLVTIFAAVTITKREPDIQFIKRIIEDIVLQKQKNITIDTILGIVSDYYSISIDELVSKNRKEEVVLARNIVIYLAKETNITPKVIAQKLNRDRSMVNYAITSIKKHLESPKFHQLILVLKSRLYTNN